MIFRRGDSVNRLEYEGEPSARPYKRRNILLQIIYLFEQ